MNEFSTLFQNVKNGDTVTLQQNKIYNVYPEDSFHLFGYYFSNTSNRDENPEGERFVAAFLSKKNNVTVDGNGATLLIHGIMTPFLFYHCKNITLQNLKIDYFRPTMSEFTVVASTPGAITMQIPTEFSYRIENDFLYWLSEQTSDGAFYWQYPYRGDKHLTTYFNPQTEQFFVPSTLPQNEGYRVPEVRHFSELQGGMIQAEFADGGIIIPVGTVVATRNIMRHQTGGGILECENVLLKDCRIYAMHGFGILFQNSKNITLQGLNCTPKKGRTIASNADFFHFSGCRGQITVKNCKAKGAHDDFINVHGTFLRIISVNRENGSLTVRFMHRETWNIPVYRRGDTVEFINSQNLQSYFSARVKKAVALNGTDIEVYLSKLPLTLETDCDVLENITATPSLLCENNDFSCTIGRGILCTTRKDVIIRNNTIKNTRWAALYVSDDCNFWYESGRSGRVIFENNTVIGVGTNADREHRFAVVYEPMVIGKGADKPVHGTFIMAHNRFIGDEECKGYLLQLNYLKKAIIRQNDFDAPVTVTAEHTQKLNR